MISVIYGAQGSGKTARIMDAANAAAASASGQVIFITDNAHSLGLNPNVRFINLAEYSVKSAQEFIGFIKGMLAANFDIQKIYIDGMSRLLGISADGLKPVFEAIASLGGAVDFVATVSADKLPTFLKDYAVKG